AFPYAETCDAQAFASEMPSASQVNVALAQQAVTASACALQFIDDDCAWHCISQPVKSSFLHCAACMLEQIFPQLPPPPLLLDEVQAPPEIPIATAATRSTILLWV